jgi:hypothetical protein
MLKIGARAMALLRRTKVADGRTTGSEAPPSAVCGGRIGITGLKRNRSQPAPRACAQGVTQKNYTATMLWRLVPERKVLCGIQFIMNPPREKPDASPASLEIKMKVFMHMIINLDID